jgi:WD40 repeat protein
LWRPDGSRWLSDLQHPSIVEVVAFSPNDGKWLVTGCRDGGVRLWSVDSGVWTGAGWYHSGPVTRVQFSTDGTRVLSAGRDGTARVSTIPEHTEGDPSVILAGLEADAGIQISTQETEAGAVFAAPQPLTRADFLKRRAGAR